MVSKRHEIRNNKWQTFDMYLHKTNDCARPYEKLAYISTRSFLPRRGIFPQRRDARRLWRLFWQPIAILYFYWIPIPRLNLKLSNFSWSKMEKLLFVFLWFYFAKCCFVILLNNSLIASLLNLQHFYDNTRVTFSKSLVSII